MHRIHRVLCPNPVDAYNQVREAAREKILRMLGKIDDAIFNLIL